MHGLLFLIKMIIFQCLCLDIDINLMLVTKMIIIFKQVWVRSIERAEGQVEGDTELDKLTYLSLVISIFHFVSDGILSCDHLDPIQDPPG